MAKKFAILLLAYASTEALAASIWEKHCSKPLKVITASPATTLRSVAEDAIADNEVADVFVIVPPGCIPCANVDFAELTIYKAQELKSGELIYNRLPIAFRKSELVSFLADEKNDLFLEDETFAKAWVTSKEARPMKVSFHYGNYLTPVNRANPCEYRVIEAMATKRFITASEEGWFAIEPFLKKGFNL